jgi:hypothetical protein
MLHSTFSVQGGAACRSVIRASTLSEAIQKHEIIRCPKAEDTDMDFLGLSSVLIGIKLEIDQNFCQAQTPST